MQVASTSKLVLHATTRCMRCASTTSRSKAASGRKSRTPVKATPPNSMPFNEAIRTLRALSPGNTDAAFELTLIPKLATSVNVNALRGRCFLKHDASSPKKKEVIVVFAEGVQAEAARKQGADIVGGQELVDDLLQGKTSPTKVISTPDLLPLLTRSGLPRVLGPKGLMPSVKRGSVTDDIAKAIQEARGGLDWKGSEIGPSSKTKAKSAAARGMVSVPIARIDFDAERVKENVSYFARQVLDVSNGVGTQAELSGTSTDRKKMADIEKLFLTTSQGMSVEVSDFRSMLP